MTWLLALAIGVATLAAARAWARSLPLEPPPETSCIRVRQRPSVRRSDPFRGLPSSPYRGPHP